MSSPADPAGPALVLPGPGGAGELDACLDALRGMAVRLPVLLCARTGPGVEAVLARWAGERRLRRIEIEPEATPARQLAALLAAAGSDVVVLAPGVVPAPGCVEALLRALAAHPAAASVTPWSNDGELAGFPRIGECSPPPADPAALARQLAPCEALPELPLGGCHAVALRGRALLAVGGVDCESFSSAYAALVDLFLRQRGHGFGHLLCAGAFATSRLEQGPALDDMQRLNARFPDYGPMLARFLMDDPLRKLRTSLAAQPAPASAASQGELFA